MPIRRCPTRERKKSIRRVEMPLRSMTLPPKIKNGMASRTNLLVEAYILEGITDSGRSMETRVKTLAIPREIAMGTFSSSMAKKEPNKISAVISHPPLPFFHGPFGPPFEYTE